MTILPYIKFYLASIDSPSEHDEVSIHAGEAHMTKAGGLQDLREPPADSQRKSYSCKKIHSANNMNEPEVNASPVKPPDENTA